MPAQMDQEQLDRRLRAISERLRAIEDHLVLLSGKAGVPYEPPSGDVPKEVIEMARAGDTLGAMKKYREITGAGADAAREAILSI